jgi:HEAT repeat protein
VSDAARSALEQRLRPADAAAWIAILPFERHVRALKRRALAYLFDTARHLLVQPDGRSAVREALVSGPTETRRACAELAFSLPDGERTSLLAVAIRDRDPVVASMAATSLLKNGTAGGAREVIETLLAHRVAAVRTQALTALAAHRPGEALDPLRMALFDSARSVREIAQFELRRRCGVEPLPFYVAMVPHAIGPKLMATISGLAECGSAKEAVLVAPFLRDSSPRIRFEALRAVARLDGDAYASAFLDALEDVSPRVVRMGREALRRRAHLVERARLDALLAAGGRLAREALLLLPQIDHWGALLESLRAASVPELREVAVRVFERLVGRQTYSLPPDHAALERALAAAPIDLPMAPGIKDLLKLTRPRGRSPRGGAS